eukprot:11169401-Lingulodinium_polyedra.AAC.1
MAGRAQRGQLAARRVATAGGAGNNGDTGNADMQVDADGPDRGPARSPERSDASSDSGLTS